MFTSLRYRYPICTNSKQVPSASVIDRRMGDGEWLSTRNRKKVTQPQPRIQRRRISTSKPMKSTCLQVSHSPPPRQLFTATKQSSLNDFFSTSEDHDVEVEVNSDEDSQNRCLDQITDHACSETRKSELRKPEKKRCDNLCTDMFERNRHCDYSRIFENESKHFVINSFKSDARTNDAKDITPEHISTSFDEEVKKLEVKNEELEEVNDVLNNFEGTDLKPEIEEGSCLLGNKESVNRKRCGSELSHVLCPSVKRIRTDAEVFKNGLELIDNTLGCNEIKSVEQNDASEQTNAAVDRFTECNVVSQDLSVPVSYFSQSLQFQSQLSLSSQQSVLETDFALTLDTGNEIKEITLDKTDLLEKELSETSLSLSSQAERVDSVSLEIPFTLNSQSENEDKTYEHSVSASLDLSDQSESLYIGTDGIENDVIAPNDHLTDSQLSFGSSSPDQLLTFESLQLP